MLNERGGERAASALFIAHRSNECAVLDAPGEAGDR